MIAAAYGIHVARKPDEVFAYFADLRNEEQWNHGHVRDVVMVTPEPVEKGSRFEGRHAGSGRATWVITDYDPPRHVRIEGEAFGSPYTYVGDFEPDQDGTRMTGRIEWAPKRGARALEPVLRLVLRAQAGRSFHRFKEAMELRARR